MDFKQYLREEEERVDEILPVIAGIARGASVVGRGLTGGAKAAAGAAKQFIVNRAKKKAVNKAGEVAQNTLAPQQQTEVTRMYITKAGRDLLEAMDAAAAKREEDRRGRRQHGRSTSISLAAGHQASAEMAKGDTEAAKVSIERGRTEVQQRGRRGSAQRKKYIKSGKKLAPQTNWRRSSDK